MTYDKLSHELALTFLEEVHPALNEAELGKHAHSLAQSIQGTIEDYLQDLEYDRDPRNNAFDPARHESL